MLRRPNPTSPRVRLGALVVVAGIAGLLGGCGRPDEASTALALEDPTWAGPERVIGFVECAEDVRVRVEPGAGVEGLPLVTVSGRPKLGRCRPAVVVDVPAGTTRLEDAASGTVVDLPAR